jgi:tetratricopeptide (TPR) repeat protein
MKRYVWLMALVLCAPLSAQDKDKDKDKKGKDSASDKKGGSPDDLVKQADLKTAAGDVPGAIELLRKAAAMPTAGGEVSLKLGQALDSRLELDGAIAAYRAAAEKSTGAVKAEALGRMAVAQEVRGVAEAAASADAAFAADPSAAWALVAASRSAARKGKADEALALAEKAKAAGGGAAALGALGRAREAKGDAAGAEAAYREALAAEPGRASSSIGLARTLRLSKRAAEAEPLLAAVIDKAPGAVEAYKEMARTKIALGRTDEAVGDAATAAAMSENDPDAHTLVEEITVAKALAQVARGETELAIQDLTMARDRAPESAAIRFGLAQALLARRMNDPALVELQKTVELDPKNADAYFRIGQVQHILKGNPAAAVPALEKAVAAAPANAEYRTALGAALSDTKQYDRAIEELGKASQAATPRADTWIYLGAAQLAQKKYKEAIAALDKGVELAPQSAQAEAYLGWCYFGLKDPANFKKHAGRAKELGYKEPTLLDYLRRIEAGEPIK